MPQADKAKRQNRTLTVDFHDQATYFELLSDGKAFVEFVLAFIFSLGFQLAHKSTCDGGGSVTRHAHDARVRLGGLTMWRMPCTRCRAVFTALPDVTVRYPKRRPEAARGGRIGLTSVTWRDHIPRGPWGAVNPNRP
jgi:hypothetical protein